MHCPKHREIIEITDIVTVETEKEYRKHKVIVTLILNAVDKNKSKYKQLI